MKLHKWKRIDLLTQYMRVEGGWVYKSTENGAVTMVFVPFPEDGKSDWDRNNVGIDDDEEEDDGL